MIHHYEIGDLMDLPADEAFLERLNRQTIAAYREKPTLIEEHVRQEAAIREGAYSRRQVYELVQNAIDVLRGRSNGRIHVLLADDALYCADSGNGLTNRGLVAILNSYLSPKQGDEIGRYGLGFKSVLAVTSRPEFYSGTLAFRFDPDWSRRQIRAATGYTGECPVLRLACPVDRAQEFEKDPVLGQFAAWAATIVKLPLTEPAPWLGNDIVTLPPQVLLFAPHVHELILEDSVAGVKRVLRCDRGEVYRLYDDRDVTEWHVFESDVSLPDDIRREGGIFSGRDSIRIAWAVPVRGGTGAGGFWAYFPLEKEEMSLKGILNAPWKLNDDRTNILPGRFTAYLLERAVELVFRNLPTLVDPQDPGKILEVYPARFEERRGTDLELTIQFYRQAAFMPSIPDTHGELRKATELNLPPRELVPKAIEEWLSAPDLPRNWAHASCATTTVRQARIELLRPADKPRARLKDWLEVLSGASQPGLSRETRIQRSGHAIRAAAALIENGTREILEQVRTARIVLTESFEYVPADPNQVFLPSPESEPALELPLVHSALAREVDTNFALTQLGISVLDASSELRSFIHSRGLHHLRDDDWDRLWRIVDRIVEKDGGDAVSVLLASCGEHFSRYDIRVRTLAGTFRRIGEVLLPGSIVSGAADSPDRAFTIDTNYHRKHVSVLGALGAVSEPQLRDEYPGEEWFIRYHRECVETYIENLRRAGIQTTPRESFIQFDQTEVPAPLGVLSGLSPEARARMSHALLPLLEPASWTMSHKTIPTYPRAEVPSPVKWMLERYGYLNTSLGPRPIPRCVGPGLSRFKTFLPVADCNERQARLLGCPNGIDELPSPMVAEVLWLDVEPSPELVAFWAAVCESVPPPDELVAWVGSGYRREKPSSIAVGVGTRDDFSIFEKLGVPYVVAPSRAEAERLRRYWRLKDPSALVERSVYYEPAGESVPLLNLFPALQLYVDEDLEPLSVVPCRVLEVSYSASTGRKSIQVREIRDGDQLMLLMEPKEDVGLYSESTLDRVLTLLNLRLDPQARQVVLAALEKTVQDQRIAEVAREQNLARKLLLAVGVDALREALPEEILRNTPDDPIAIARRFHAVFGVESLIVLKDALRAAGFYVPGTWAGSFEARRFVRQLGFPEPYAGFASSERPASLEIPAPVRLPPLHDFQERLVERILELVSSKTGPRRGLLSLPTGAGKTRVTVEALVRAMNSGLIRGSILWIAQTEELCEQAVQAWAELWAAKGERSALRINRLWSTREADRYPDGPQVVVATPEKLDHIRERPEYDWLSEAATVVIDEAHESITPSYTRTLEWLGIHRSRTRCPLLGLSATPFRGSEEETRRLAVRYERNRLDHGLFKGDPYKELQRMGILAQVDHELLEGVRISLTDEELVHLEQYDQLPRSAARELTLHEKRNRQIIESIRSKPPTWSIVVFALSVNHAKLLAAALMESGIPAAAVSGQTDPGARRYYIEQFKAGRIRVLTNYGVLTTGFDAPKVRAIYVARPVFSPSRYQQMIGRGLRGPRNGGTERCLIVNIADTFERFGRDLAFREFEYLWS